MASSKNARILIPLLAAAALAGAALAQSGPPRFAHGTEKHRTVACSACHTVTAAAIDVTRFPGHAACVTCHNMALEALEHAETHCGICHDGRALSPARTELRVFYGRRGRGDLGTRFSHPAHLKSRAGYAAPGLEPAPPAGSALVATREPVCGGCHRAGPATAGSPDMSRETGHAACFRCHGENPVQPPSMQQCAECHARSGERAPRLYGVISGFRHGDHTIDLRPKKKSSLPLDRPADYLCQECHVSAAAAAKLTEIRMPRADYCGTCHNGRTGLPEPLPAQVLGLLERP